MKKCKKCGYMNNQSNNFCINCGGKLPDRKTKYLILTLVFSVVVLGLNILSCFIMHSSEISNLFIFFIFNIAPIKFCIFSAIYSIVLLKSKKSSKKAEKEFMVPVLSFLVGVVLSLPAMAVDAFFVHIATNNIID